MTAIVTDTFQGPTLGTGVQNTYAIHPFQYASKNNLLTVSTQVEVLYNDKNVPILVGTVAATEVSNNATTWTLRKRARTASDANSQRLFVTKPVTALGTDNAFNGVLPFNPIVVLQPGEALFITAADASRVSYNISYCWERT